jgi:hypothetical protein
MLNKIRKDTFLKCNKHLYSMEKLMEMNKQNFGAAFYHCLNK